jgi:hypothetical protein
MEEIIKAVKGFNPDMTCTPTNCIKFQYEEGETYEEKEVDVCKKGFHACELPINVFRYYTPTKSVYHKVEMSGKIDNSENDKVCSSKIKIGAKINIAGIIKASVDIIRGKAEKESSASSGDYGNAASSGYKGNAASSGYKGNAASSGYKGNAASSGDCGNAASSGDYGNAASSGYKGNAASSGDYGNAASSGNCGNAASSGYKGSAKADHPNSCAIAWGPEAKASGVIGSHLVLAEWESNGGYYFNEETWTFKGTTMIRVDGENIKENTWYGLRNGKVIEIKED